MSRKHINALVTLRSSASHIGETQSIQSVFHREKILDANGNILMIPTITGNAIRGILRDCASRYLLDTIGVEKIALPAFYLLFSGGSLHKSSGRVSIGKIEELRELIPVLSLFGGAMENVIINGRLMCDKMIPIARETIHIIPDDYQKYAGQSLYDLMQIERYTRHDDVKNYDLRQYLIEMDVSSNPADNPQQMRYEVETLAQGTRLAWGIGFDFASDMDILCLVSGLRVWGNQPTIGGKGAIGHGQVTVHFDNGWIVESGALSLPDLAIYDAYLHDNAGLIKDALDNV